jgi:DNA repair ATPase RecN
MDPKKYEILLVLPPGGAKYVPSVPSLLSGLRVNLSTSLAKISNIDFEKMSKELSSALTNANNILSGPKLNGIITKAESLTSNLDILSKHLKSTFTEEKLNSLLNDVKETLENINRLSQTAEKEMRNSKIPKTTAAARKLKEELSESFSKLNETLDSIQELVDSISDDPSSLIRGKQSKKAF